MSRRMHLCLFVSVDKSGVTSCCACVIVYVCAGFSVVKQINNNLFESFSGALSQHFLIQNNVYKVCN